MNTKPVDFTNAYQFDGKRWIVASNPAHYSGYAETLEIREDGTITLWQYAGMGCCIGNQGALSSLKPGTILKHVTNAKERAEVEHKVRLINRGIENSQAMYERLKMAQASV